MTRLHDSDPTYPLFPIFAFVGFFVSLVPLPWHLQAWNSGTCWYMFWASLSCLNQFVNSVVWAGNVFNSAPAWCEICAYRYSHLPPLRGSDNFQPSAS
jgi:pheromone a factor receptor